jgi:hypothetical protein
MENKLETWTKTFKNLYCKDKDIARNWFWQHFDWKNQSIWVGKLTNLKRIPNDDETINNLINKLIDELNTSEKLKNRLYLKFYFSRNTNTKEPEVNYLMVCNSSVQLPAEFENSIINLTFEKYQITEKIFNGDPKFKQLVNHYIDWNNFYNYYNLIWEKVY